MLDTAVPCAVSVWYSDGDGDGYGADDLVQIACDLPDGYVDEDAADALLWFADADGDGYGSTTHTVDACEQPSGYLAAAGDGDDCQ